MNRHQRRTAKRLVDKAMKARRLEPRWIEICAAHEGARLYADLQELRRLRGTKPWRFLDKPEPTFGTLDFHDEWCAVYNLTDSIQTFPTVAAAPVIVAPEEVVILNDEGDTLYKISTAGVFRDAGQPATIDPYVEAMSGAVTRALAAN